MSLRRAILLALLTLPWTRPADLPRPQTPRPHPRPAAPRAEADRPPNILLVVADDMAAGLMGIDGDPRRATPNLDRLARQGTRFTRAYCNAPVCSASRQSLITGKMPHAAGVTQLMTPLPDTAVTLGDWLGELGYRTAAFGKMHFNGPSHHGFAEMADTMEWFRHTRLNPPRGGGRRAPWAPFHEHPARWLNAACEPSGLPASAEEAAYFVDRAAAVFREPDSRPFLVVVAFHEPHAPFVFPRDWTGRFQPDQFAVPSVSEAEERARPRAFDDLTPDHVRGIQAAYFSSLAWMDHNVGRLLQALDESGQADETIVVFVSDNGYLLGQHGRFEKNCCYEPAVRVPMILRWPDRVRADQIVATPVELVDVVPTILALAGQPAPPAPHGQDLGPILRGEAPADPQRVVVSEYLENEEAAAISGRFKLIVGTGARHRRDNLEDRLPLPGMHVHLFDIEDDPEERHDLSADPNHRSTMISLRQSMLKRLAGTREGLDPVPSWLDEDQALAWCLVPRDRDHLDPRLAWLERWLR